MEDQDLRRLSELMSGRQVATLAVTVEGSPFASLVPFAMTPGNRSALIHASALARHSKGLTDGARYSLLIHEPDSRPDANPAQLARVTFSGSVHPLERDSDEYSRAQGQYLSKFPKSQITFQLGDFTLYELAVEDCRFVAGFGKAFDVSQAELEQIGEGASQQDV